MESPSGRWILVYNGELYNYREIKAQLPDRTYRSGSDTEVLACALEHMGTAAFRLFNGMFAFAAYDQANGKLYLVRDRLGIKPLYYYDTPKQFLFSSEIKGIKRIAVSAFELNRKMLPEWLYYGNSLGEKTLFAKIKSVLPGTYLEMNVHSGRWLAKSYWCPESLLRQKRHQEKGIVNQTRNLLKQAVRRQMVSDVPIGILLSGGIDSSAITAFASEEASRPLNTYSVSFDYEKGVNELSKARKVAAKYQTQHHEFHLRGSDMLSALDTLVYHHDMPFSDAANLPLYLITQSIAKDVKVILQGDGGDEIFAGYRRYATLDKMWRWQTAARLFSPLHQLVPRNEAWYKRERYLKLLACNNPAEQAALLLTVESPTFNPMRVFCQDLRNTLADIDPFERVKETFARFPSLDPVHRMLLIDSQITLPDIFLQKVDRSTMASSVEVRVPFLDHELVDFMIPMSGSQRMMRHGRKGLLKECLRGYVPDEILFGPKTGFGVPFGFWLRTSLKEYFYDLMKSKEIVESGILDTNEIQVRMNEHCKYKADWGFLLWKVMNLAIWLRRWKLS